MRAPNDPGKSTKAAGRLISVLLIDDHPTIARMIPKIVAMETGGLVQVETADRLVTGIERLAAGGIDAVLLDLSLPDSDGLDTLGRVQERAFGVPVVVLTGLDDETLGIEAVQRGAQDFLVKGEVDNDTLIQSLRSAIEWKRLNPSAMVQDPARLEALRRTALLDSPAEAAFDRLTHLACTIFQVPVALVSLVDQDRQFFKSSAGLPEPWASRRQTPLSHSFCQYAVASGQPLVIPDARRHPLVRTNRAIPDLGVAAYAGIPLITGDGHALGAFCVMDARPRAWTEGEIEVLRGLAASVLTEIELRAAIHEARRRAEEAEEAVRVRNEVLAIVSHDLGNPLMTILSWAEVLSRQAAAASGPEPVKVQQGLEKITTATLQMQGIIRELLAVARLQAGQPLHLERQPTDLVDLLRREAGACQQETDRHHIRVEVDVPELVGRWDAARLGRVFANLLNNAVKYSPNGGEVRVTVRREASAAGEGGWAVVEIRDEGVGIPVADLPHLFERFHRGGNVLGRIAGTGLGLAGSRPVIKQHGGAIGVTSQEGVGTTIIVRLPLD